MAALSLLSSACTIETCAGYDRVLQHTVSRDRPCPVSLESPVSRVHLQYTGNVMYPPFRLFYKYFYASLLLTAVEFISFAELFHRIKGRAISEQKEKQQTCFVLLPLWAKPWLILVCPYFCADISLWTAAASFAVIMSFASVSHVFEQEL